ncbi:heme ABC exporter ATP-binding protein CcmA [Jannaschia sp. W003]|uniref:heme ABC exporter ATP-binding protein CcmA n=1 Tax=Jannaschia sp. W003 TaxID=2867012 RepID=UPI0021A616E3|nr:heme ABC exporter ATP-binding protein CcmA [Jannaschia sp. W003]UWQ23065.1 heme ABC exporter ATP-binding protein CcmA [Jannaschia sp. W003]
MDWGVTDLSCRRGEAVVLRGVGFRVAAGTALVLRGPNGAGKTTLLRTLAGLAAPVAGRIDAAPDAFAFGGHADALKAQLTVAENLQFWADAYGTAQAGEALERMRLGPLAHRRAAELSAGQRRRAGLARLLVTGRPVWLLDEPTVSLDAEAVILFADVLRGHLASGGSAAVATHVPLGLEAPALDLAPFAVGREAVREDDPFAEAVE